MATVALPYTEEDIFEYYEALQEVRLIDIRQRERRERFERINKGVRTTSLAAVFIVFLIAGVSDLLSLIDLGWITSWLFSLLMWTFIKNRISAIEKSSEEMGEFAQELEQDLKTYALEANLEIVKSKPPSYGRIFIRDTIITQAIELVPVIDVLPFYLGQMVKALRDQQKIRRDAQKMVAYCEQMLDMLESKGV
ncbi:MAG: hypothetical protein A2941_02150 [Candidatus Yanofskybacteria bacterium RIFCSPLOWO2_01_FULL_49_17]|uniref:SMODS and SLOG-associating 2TM effector domain-containing protein n=1 Tax=Candidatus Yanofskybacteria bacterium RIFCSPLOWO2_01_FULL_49_17 TaxID=1802700 RepID=A0A1F8GSC5_9BACT|nr:MAG: hypothetical protein A2941_02150 [Candidatus Yanofskybacteria bacterium RIFCSPLOWO2_01_FULL_49_17]